MSWLDRLLARRDDVDLADEIQEHLDEKTDELMREGMSREEAARAARRAFGNVTLTRERGREVWRPQVVDTILADVRYGCRQLARSPASTLVAILSSALGLGAAATLFSIVYGVLITPYPYKDPARIVHLHVFREGAFVFDLPLSTGQFDEFRQSPVLQDAMAMDVESLASTGAGSPVSVTAGHLSTNAFDFLGVAPQLGHVFPQAPSKGLLNPRQVVLTDRFWRQHYAARPDIVGQRIELDRESYEVVGVMPPRFTWWDCDIYLPLMPSSDANRVATVVARLAPGIDEAGAQRELQQTMERLARERPGALPSDFELRIVNIGEIAAGPVSSVVSVTAVAVGLLLTIGCANVAILLLARGTARVRELSIRVAVGASRGRIVRQLLTESLVISLAGAALGAAFAHYAVTYVPALLPAGTFPSESVVQVNVPVVLFSVALAVLTGMLFGLLPAFRLSHPALGSMGPSAFVAPIVRGTLNGHYLLIVGQVALTVALLAGAGATLRGFERLTRTRLNFVPADLTSVRVDLRDNTYTTWTARTAYAETIRNQVAAMPGVVSAALTVGDLPPALPFHSSRVVLPGDAFGSPAALVSKVGGDYFTTLQIPILAGRAFTSAETSQAARVAVVNETMARVLWPGKSPLWERVQLPDLKSATAWSIDAAGNDGWVEVVGVAADTPNTGLKDPVAPGIFVPYTLVADDSFRVVVRASGSAAAIASGVAERIHAIDADQPVGEVHAATDLLASQGWARERFTASLFSALAILAIVLSAAGLYSVVSYVAAQRLQELAVRAALGARRTDLMRTVWGVAMSPTLVGVSVGLALCRTLDTLLMAWTRESAADPYVMAPVAAVLFASASLAALLPALRAASVDPLRVLRSE